MPAVCRTWPIPGAALSLGHHRVGSGELQEGLRPIDQGHREEQLLQGCSGIAAGMHHQGQFVVAVVPFTSSEKGTSIASKVQAHAMTALTESKDPFLKVVDRENMDRILEEQRLSLSGVVDEQTAVRVGNIERMPC
ncbi:MAG: CsgG/HfaB family protein [Flavobacteriales bacterium]